MGDEQKPPEITKLAGLLERHIYNKSNDDGRDYIEFKEGTSREARDEVYESIFNFFLLDTRVFISESSICEKLSGLFRRPTVDLGFGIMPNFIICSYAHLEFTLFCIRRIKAINESEDKSKQDTFESIVAGLNAFDNGYAFNSSTPRQIVYFTEDKTDDCKLISHLLSLCISIQKALENLGIKQQLTTFCCNRIVSLYVNLTNRNPIRYTTDFDTDENWLHYVIEKKEAQRKIQTLLRNHAKNPYMTGLLNSILRTKPKSNPPWKPGGGGSRNKQTNRNSRGCLSTKRSKRTTRRHTRRRRR
jgi:hypothetical protein